MNKKYEAGMLIAVAVLLTMPAFGMYQNSGHQTPGSVDKYITEKWNTVVHWMKTKKNFWNMDKSLSSFYKENSAQKPSSVPPVETSANSISTDQIDTYKRLTQIGGEFVDSMNQRDWQNFIMTLTNKDSTDADKVVKGYMVSHLSSGDITWVAHHFQGTQSFNQTDIALLQKSLREAELELTPKELVLLHQASPLISSTQRH